MNAATMNNGLFDLSAEVAVVIGGTALFQPVDAMDLHSLTSARDAVSAQWGPVSVLVNAAGGNRPDAATDADFCRGRRGRASSI